MLGGIWRGELVVLGGKLETTISIVPLTGGGYFAALDVPEQRVSRMSVETEVQGDSVRFWVPQAACRFVARFDTARKELIGTWSSAGVQTPLVLHHAPMPALAPAKRRYARSYREEDVVFVNPQAKMQLAGAITVPPGKGPFPAVLLLSDRGAQDRDGTSDNSDFRLLGALADGLTKHGLVVLRYDDRGVGASNGQTANTTIEMRASDVQAALNFLRSLPEVNIARIGVVGHGEGANVGLLAATLPLPPAFVVSLAGYGLPGQQALLQQLVNKLRVQGESPARIQACYERQLTMYDIIRNATLWQARAIVANMLRQDCEGMDPAAVRAEVADLTSIMQRDFLVFDPLATLDQVHCPVLLLNGTNDEETPAALHLTALAGELKSVNHAVTIKRLPGVNHLMQPPRAEWTLLNAELVPLVSPTVQEVLYAWIKGVSIEVMKINNLGKVRRLAQF
jgi:pimeloyl-ACP methyl ester carboxylesterase